MLGCDLTLKALPQNTASSQRDLSAAGKRHYDLAGVFAVRNAGTRKALRVLFLNHSAERC